VAVSVATFMLLLDITVVNVALPSILEDLGPGFNLDQTLAAFPQTHHLISHAAVEEFLAGFNDVPTLGALLSLTGAALALWLVREHEIERQEAAIERAHLSPAPRCPGQHETGRRNHLGRIFPNDAAFVPLATHGGGMTLLAAEPALWVALGLAPRPV